MKGNEVLSLKWDGNLCLCTVEMRQGRHRRQPMHQAVQEQGSSRKGCVLSCGPHAPCRLCSCNSQSTNKGRQHPETDTSSSSSSPPRNSFPITCRGRHTPPNTLHILNANSDAGIFPPGLIWAGSVHHNILLWQTLPRHLGLKGFVSNKTFTSGPYSSLTRVLQMISLP